MGSSGLYYTPPIRRMSLASPALKVKHKEFPRPSDGLCTIAIMLLTIPTISICYFAQPNQIHLA